MMSTSLSTVHVPRRRLSGRWLAGYSNQALCVLQPQSQIDGWRCQMHALASAR
jgi:hypothetical protein